MNKYEFVDALRGWAILGVVLYHSTQWVEPTSGTLMRIAFQGPRGVQLFFVASAFTLFLSMNTRAKQETRPTRNFFIRRFFRIAPLFYLAIVVYTLINGLSASWSAPNGVQWWYIPLTALFLNGWHPETITSVVPGGWSIAVEMTFYACLPFLVTKLGNLRSASIFVFGCLIFEWLSSGLITHLLVPLYPIQQQYLASWFAYFWFFGQLPIFGLGIVTYHIFTKYRGVKDTKTGLVLLACALFLFASFLEVSTFEDLLPQHFLYAVAFCVFALALHFYPQRLFVNQIICWVGKLSFSVYLTHFAVLFVMERIFQGSLALSGNLGSLATFFLALLFSIGISVVTYNLVERPGINLGRNIIRRLERPLSPDRSLSLETE